MSPSSSRLVQTDTIGDDDDDDNEGLVQNDIVWGRFGWANISYWIVYVYNADYRVRNPSN